MLYKKNRLAKKKDFEKIFKNGKTIKGDFLYLKFQKNELSHSRFGFVVSKKVSNKATKRNLIKRRLRNLARLELKNIKDGFDVIMVALPAIISRKYPEIKKETLKILESAMLLKPF